MFLQNLQTLASYNRWMNEKLYARCAELTDAQRKQDSGAFFKSIHGTLNHLLLADKVWLGRFVNIPYPVESLAQELYSDYSELSKERENVDTKIIRWADWLSEEDLSEQLSYTSISDGKPKSIAISLAATHFFNHQTHHRGQVTTLLSQLGKEVGVTDFIAMR